MNAKRSFGEWVGQRRKALGLTQNELAQQVGCAPSTIQKIEIDARQPSHQMAELLADHLDVDSAERDTFLHLARSQSASVAPPLILSSAPRQPIHNLPTPLTALIGREWEVTALRARLLQPDIRLLNIVGPPGIGKTRLALAAAQAMTPSHPAGSQYAAPHSQHFSDGICFVPLASIGDARFVAVAIAHALGLKDAGGQPPLERVKAFLHNLRLLLVLDNFEHLLSAALLVVDLLEAAPALKILVTSRALLQVYGEHEFAARPLTVPDLRLLPPADQLLQYAAVDLFVQRVRASQQEFSLSEGNARTVAEICVRLEGLPLAVELAAARSKTMALPALLARLNHAFAKPLDLLVGAQNLPARQRTMRNAIAWSYDLLTPTEQRVFRCLGVFSGGCTLDALSAVVHSLLSATSDLASVSVDGWLATAVESLVGQNLTIQRQGPNGELRFMLLEMMREYALEQLEEHGEADRVQRVHAVYFLQLAERFRAASTEGKAAALLGHMEMEIDNFRAALQWARENDFAFELRFATALTEFWGERRQLSEGRQWLEQLLPRIKEVEAQLQPQQWTQYAYLSGTLALFTWLQGDNALAQSRWEASIALWRRLQNWHELGLALHFLAFTFYDRGDYTRAHYSAAESVHILREFGEPWALGWALCVVGSITVVEGDDLSAQTIFEEALAIFRTINHSWSISLASLGISEVFFSRGEDARARCYLEVALQTFRQDDQLWFVAQTLCMLGKVLWRQGDRSQAIASWEESLLLGRDVGAKRYMAEASFMLGLVAQEDGDSHRAQAYFSQSLELYQAVENRIGAAYALCGLAGIHEQPEQRAQMLADASVVLEATRLPFDQIERDHYARMMG